MPNIIEQRIDDNGIYIKATNGREFTLSRSQLASRFATETGTRTGKKAQTVSWSKEEIVKALGEDMMSVEDLDFDMDDNQHPRALSITGTTDEREVAIEVRA